MQRGLTCVSKTSLHLLSPPCNPSDSRNPPSPTSGQSTDVGLTPGDLGRSAYQREYQRRWIAARRARFFAGKACAACGATEALELDHVDPSQKEDHRIWSWSDGRRSAEIAKCRVLCSTCHRTRHADERRKALVHGTANAYKKRACRCDQCRAWNASYKASLKGRPGEARGRALICAVAVAVLAAIWATGCRADRPVDISACYQRCVALGGPYCGSEAFAGWQKDSPAAYCICTCHYPMPFADGGRP